VLVFEGDARFRALTESFKGSLISMAAGAGAAGAGDGGRGGMHLDFISCDPGGPVCVCLYTSNPVYQ
jgi:hypothetical protein